MTVVPIHRTNYMGEKAKFLNVGIPGSRIPDLIQEKSGQFWKMNN